jgi:rare lipoprotein A
MSRAVRCLVAATCLFFITNGAEARKKTIDANGSPATENFKKVPTKHQSLSALIASINYKLAKYVHKTGKCGGSRETLATYYWQGRRVASGGRFYPNGLTAAHRTLPFGTVLHVTNPHNGRSTTVTVNDRGPFTHAEIDLSLGAAKALGLTQSSYVCIAQAGHGPLPDVLKVRLAGSRGQPYGHREALTAAN